MEVTGGARRLHGDAGQATLEQMGVLALAAVVITAVLLAFTANTPAIGTAAARLICQVVTLGTGSCGGATETGPEREPTTPCLLASDGDRIEAGLSFTFISIGGNRGFTVEEMTDGTYRVRATTGGEAAATAGVGATMQFTVADTEFGAGASASVAGGAQLQGGREWIVSSPEEAERLASAENWERADSVLSGMPVLSGLPLARRLLGIGEQYPPPDRIYVEGGLYADASAYAGAGAVARASLSTSQLLGYSYSPDDEDEHTFYYRTTTEGEAFAGIPDIGGNAGASLSGSVETMTAITVRDGEIVRAARTGIATGESSGLTNALFGEDFTTSTGDSVGTGVQYEAVLDVESAADLAAVQALIASAGIDAAGLGLSGSDPTGDLDPLSRVFMDAVRDRGDLTRTGVEADGSTLFAGDVSLEAGPVAGVNGGYSTSTMDYDSPEYFDGTRFVARTNC
jgi:hypothetical protein